MKQPVRIREDAFTVTRDRILGEARERFPFAADLSSIRVITRSEVARLAASPGWVTRTRDGSYQFDWRVAERALGRELAPLEQRVLRESVMTEPGVDDVAKIVAGIDAFLLAE